jgi:hypothetical protein
VDGEFNGFALCGLAVFGLRWVFPGKEIVVDANCIDCGETLRLRLKDDEILEREPASIIGLITLHLMMWSQEKYPERMAEAT